ncbi:MAG: hypothetical protein ACKVQJ_02160 [Pyrinomonadaceae bacterium]
MSNESKSEEPEPVEPLSRGVIAALSIATAVVYFFSNPKPQTFYDYTFRVAANMLGGRVAFTSPQPTWLNEFVPFEGFYYSVFPLGAVLSMMPAAMLKTLGLITEMPGALIAAILAGVVCFLLLKIAARYDVSRSRRVLMTLGVLFGTFMWTNLTFEGAWQLALGFAMVGEIGAFYFTVYDRRPLIAGVFFALAFGNRTENLLTAPVFMYLLTRPGSEPAASAAGQFAEAKTTKDAASWPPAHAGGSDKLRRLTAFGAVPFVLGVATLIYNYARFHSFTDFGYSRIPGVLEEPWYNHGIFSLYYIPRQAWEMLIKFWDWKSGFPYFVPNGFSSSILLSSPFLLFLLRFGSRDRAVKYACWAAVVILTFLLWIHGNSGGWQFGYRYAMVLLPWIFVILLESGPKRVTAAEWTLYSVSFVANAYATWLFHWTEFVKP